MLQSETLSPHKTKTTKAEPKQSLTRADLKPGLACFNYLLLIKSLSLSTMCAYSIQTTVLHEFFVVFCNILLKKNSNISVVQFTLTLSSCINNSWGWIEGSLFC